MEKEAWWHDENDENDVDDEDDDDENDEDDDDDDDDTVTKFLHCLYKHWHSQSFYINIFSVN